VKEVKLSEAAGWACPGSREVVFQKEAGSAGCSGWMEWKWGEGWKLGEAWEYGRVEGDGNGGWSLNLYWWSRQGKG